MDSFGDILTHGVALLGGGGAIWMVAGKKIKKLLSGFGYVKRAIKEIMAGVEDVKLSIKETKDIAIALNKALEDGTVTAEEAKDIGRETAEAIEQSTKVVNRVSDWVKALSFNMEKDGM